MEDICRVTYRDRATKSITPVGILSPGVDDLQIEPDSLTSLRAICKLSERYEDINWVGVQNEDLLKGISIKPRTRNAQTFFKWVKGHSDDYGNNRADTPADEGRNSNTQMDMEEEEWYDNHPALQDGAGLQALEAKHMYKLLLKWHTKKITPILHQDKLEEVKPRWNRPPASNQ